MNAICVYITILYSFFYPDFETWHVFYTYSTCHSDQPHSKHSYHLCQVAVTLDNSGLDDLKVPSH